MNARDHDRQHNIGKLSSAYCELVAARIPPAERFLAAWGYGLRLTLPQARAYLPEALARLQALRPDIIAAAALLDTPEIRAAMRHAEAWAKRHNRDWIGWCSRACRPLGGNFDILRAVRAFTKGEPVEQFVFATMARAPEAAA